VGLDKKAAVCELPKTSNKNVLRRKEERRRTGSPSQIQRRTFVSTFEFPKGKGRLATEKKYPNPIGLARGWQQLLDTGEALSRADLARQLGVSAAHVTQTLRLLIIDPEVQQTILDLGDPIQTGSLGMHTLRSLCSLSAEEQKRELRRLLDLD
jgi:hypothetical protein